MNDLEIDFTSETEQGNKVFIVAKFEHIEDYVETPYGEKREVYWHLISLRIKHSHCPHMHSCDCYEPTNNEYDSYESEARNLASMELA